MGLGTEFLNKRFDVNRSVFLPRENLAKTLETWLAGEQGPAGLVKGRILSGKSRLVWEAVQGLPAQYLDPEKLSEEVLKAELDCKVLVLDSVAEVLKAAAAQNLLSELKEFLERTLAKNIFVLGVSQVGWELKTTFHLPWLPITLVEAFRQNQLDVGKLSQDEAKKLASLLPGGMVDEGDLGYAFVPIRAYAKQVKDLAKDLAKFSKAEFLPIFPAEKVPSFLASLYLASLHSEYRRSGRGLSAERVEAFFKILNPPRKTDAKEAPKGHQPFQTFFHQNTYLSKTPIEHSDWSILRKFLDKAGVGYWLRGDSDVFKVDPAVLEIVLSKELYGQIPLNLWALRFALEKLTPEAANQLQFFTQPWEWQFFLNHEKYLSLAEAEKVLARFADLGFAIDGELYAFLFSFLSAEKDSSAWLDKAVAAGIELPASLKNAQLLKTPDFAELLQKLESMGAGALPLAEGLNLVGRTKNLDQFFALSKVFSGLNEQLGHRQLQHLFALPRSLKDAEGLLESLPLAKREKTYFPTLLKWVARFEEFERIQALFPESERDFSVVGWSNLIHNCKSFQEGKRLWDFKQSVGLKPMASEAHALLRSLKGPIEVAEVEAYMANMGLPKTDGYYFEKILKTHNTNEVFAVIKNLKAAGIKMNGLIYGAIFRKIGGRYAAQLYQSMLDQGLTPNQLHFKNLIQRSRDFKFALRWFYEMCSWGVLPLFDTKNLLHRHIEKEEDKKAAEEALAFADGLVLRPGFKNQPQRVSYFLSASQKLKAERETLLKSLEELPIFYSHKNPHFKDHLPKFFRRVQGPKGVLFILDDNFFQSPFCMIEFAALTQSGGSQFAVLHFYITTEELLAKKDAVLSRWYAASQAVAEEILPEPHQEAVAPSTESSESLAQGDPPKEGEGEKSLGHHDPFAGVLLSREEQLKQRFAPQIEAAFHKLAKIPLFSFTAEQAIGFAGLKEQLLKVPPRGAFEAGHEPRREFRREKWQDGRGPKRKDQVNRDSRQSRQPIAEE